MILVELIVEEFISWLNSRGYIFCLTSCGLIVEEITLGIFTSVNALGFTSGYNFLASHAVTISWLHEWLQFLGYTSGYNP